MTFLLTLIIGACAVVILPRLGAKDNTPQISYTPVAVFIGGAILIMLAWPYIAPVLLPLYLVVMH